MQPLDAAGVLDLWERAEPLVELDRALELAAAVTGQDTQGLAELPMGRRDAAVLELYEVLAGPVVEASARCHHCGEMVEFSLDTNQLTEAGGEGSNEITLRVGQVDLTCRAPTSSDLREAANTGTVADAELALMTLCVTATGADGEPVAIGDLSAEARQAAAKAIAEADPLCEVLVEAPCPECTDPVTAVVDLPSFAWSELRRRARELLRDIDALAKSYGWSEPQVLALSDHRRATYLDLIGVTSP